jgi:hypothetical protein
LGFADLLRGGGISEVEIFREGVGAGAVIRDELNE